MDEPIRAIKVTKDKVVTEIFAMIALLASCSLKNSWENTHEFVIHKMKHLQ